MTNLPTEPTTTPRAKRLAQIVDLLAGASEVRAELVADVRSQLEGGGYVNEEKLDLAICRMLRDILQ